MGKIFLKSLVFVTIFVILFSLVSWVLCPKPESLYSLPEDCIDVVFLGTSHSYCTFNPPYLWEEYQIPSFVYAGPQQSIFMSYHYFKEVLKTQHPKVAVLEIIGFDKSEEYVPPAVSGNSLINMKFSLNRVEAVFSDLDWPDRFTWLFPLTYYHANWRNLKKANFVQEGEAENKVLGYNFLSESIASNPGELMETDGRGEILGKSLEYLDKIISLAKKEDVQLILVSAPVVYSEKAMQRDNTLSDICESKGIPFINFNLLGGAFEIDYATDFFDAGGQHLNYKGAEKVSAYMGNYFLENCGLERRPSENAPSFLSEAVEKYHQLKLEAQTDKQEEEE